ncbi:MAG: H-X9-DG-CTERM domain-containing protein, partial [Armatimonadota bacterium]
RWCPSDQDRGGDPDLWGSYLMNGLLTVGGRPIHIAEKPSETILMAERAANWRNVAGHDPSDDYSPYYDLCYDCWLPGGSWSGGTVTWPPVFEERLDTERHNGGANYGFLDGHAKWMRWNETVKSHADNLHDLH